MSRALYTNPGSASDALSTESFWKSLSSTSPQELKDKDDKHGERRNTSVPRSLEIGLMLPAEGFESEFLLKRLCWNSFENAVTKAEQLVGMGAKKLFYNRIH